MDDLKIDDLTGEDVETPSASPAGTITPESTEDNNPKGVSNTNPEEVAWNGLKGSTQDRIEKILQERDMWKMEAERRNTTVPTQNPYQVPQNPDSPVIQNAIAELSRVGIATDAKVEEKINQRIGNLIYNFELEKLSNKFDGSDGLPKFEKREYEDFVQRNPQYQTYTPEDVYQKMYPEELLEAKMKSYKPSSTSTTSLKPTKTVVRDEQWTPEGIEQRMQKPDGLEWYARNKEKINNFLSSTQTD